MKPIYKPILFFIFCFVSSFYGAKADTIDEVAVLLNKGNTKEIVRYFSSSFEISVLSDEDITSKTEAQNALKDFFTKHPPSSVRIIHRLTSNPNYRIGVLILSSERDHFRVAVSMKNEGAGFLITELRIEKSDQE